MKLEDRIIELKTEMANGDKKQVIADGAEIVGYFYKNQLAYEIEKRGAYQYILIRSTSGLKTI